MQLHRTVPDYSRRIFGRKLLLLLLLLLLLEAPVLSCPESALLAARALVGGPARHHIVVVVGLVPGGRSGVGPPPCLGRDSLRHPRVPLNSWDGSLNSRDSSLSSRDSSLNSRDSPMERLLLLNVAPVPEVLLLLLLLPPDQVNVGRGRRCAAAGRVVDREHPLLERLLLMLRRRVTRCCQVVTRCCQVGGPRGRSRRAGDGVADAGALRGEGRRRRRRGQRQHRRT